MEISEILSQYRSSQLQRPIMSRSRHIAAPSPQSDATTHVPAVAERNSRSAVARQDELSIGWWPLKPGFVFWLEWGSFLGQAAAVPWGEFVEFGRAAERTSRAETPD
jgi:hypothetical protein